MGGVIDYIGGLHTLGYLKNLHLKINFTQNSKDSNKKKAGFLLFTCVNPPKSAKAVSFVYVLFLGLKSKSIDGDNDNLSKTIWLRCDSGFWGLNMSKRIREKGTHEVYFLLQSLSSRGE